jgi:hypothetical protein
LTQPISTFLGICRDAQLAITQAARPQRIPLRVADAKVPLCQASTSLRSGSSTLRITRGPGSAGIAVMAADAYLVAFEASQIDT